MIIEIIFAALEFLLICFNVFKMAMVGVSTGMLLLTVFDALVLLFLLFYISVSFHVEKFIKKQKDRKIQIKIAPDNEEFVIKHLMWKNNNPEKSGKYFVVFKNIFAGNKYYGTTATWDESSWNINNKKVCPIAWLDTESVPMKSIV